MLWWKYCDFVTDRFLRNTPAIVGNIHVEGFGERYAATIDTVDI
jgi:hypothetical protein